MNQVSYSNSYKNYVTSLLGYTLSDSLFSRPVHNQEADKGIIVRSFGKILEKPFYRQCGIVEAYVLLLCGDI